MHPLLAVIEVASADLVSVSQLQCSAKHYSDVHQLLSRWWNVKNEGSVSSGNETRDFRCRLLVAADEIGTEGSVSLEWPKPIWALSRHGFSTDFGELTVPN